MLSRLAALAMCVAACSEPSVMMPDAGAPVECTVVPMCHDVGCPTADRLVDESCFAHVQAGEIAFCQCASFSPTTGPWCIWK